MGEWYQTHFGAEKEVVGPTSSAQRAKTLSEKPFLVYKMYRDPAVGVLQDVLIEKGGPAAAALSFKIKADPTDHGDYGPATKAAIQEFAAKAGLKNNGTSVNKEFWEALVKAKPSAGYTPTIVKKSRDYFESDILGGAKKIPWWIWIITGFGAWKFHKDHKKG